MGDEARAKAGRHGRHPGDDHELRDEGKGVALWGRDVPDETLRLVRDTVLRRRLQDGPLAIERYDLTVAGSFEEQEKSFRELLVALGLSLVLVLSAGLFLRSLQRAQEIEPWNANVREAMERLARLESESGPSQTASFAVG